MPLHTVNLQPFRCQPLLQNPQRLGPQDPHIQYVCRGTGTLEAINAPKKGPRRCSPALQKG